MFIRSSIHVSTRIPLRFIITIDESLGGMILSNGFQIRHSVYYVQRRCNVQCGGYVIYYYTICAYHICCGHKNAVLVFMEVIS